MSIWQKEKVYYVDTISDMLDPNNNFKDGATVVTSRYSVGHATGDGSGNTYVYRKTGRTGITADGGFYINGPGADDYIEATDKTVANVLQFGAVGDHNGNTGTDDTNAIQAAANAVIAGRDSGTYKFKAMGRWFGVSQTIDFGRVCGIEIEIGPRSFFDAGDNVQSAGGGFVWMGAEDGTVMEVRGRDVIFTHLCLHGKAPDNPSPTTAGVGLYVNYESNSNTGKHHHLDTAVRYAKTGVLYGGTSDNNCDETLFDYLEVSDAQVGFKTVYPQNINFRFKMYRALWVDTAMRCDAGGQYYVDSSLVYSDRDFVWLSLNNDGSKTANSAGEFVFNNMKIDSSSQTIQWVVMDEPPTTDAHTTDISITFRNLRAPKGLELNTLPLFAIKGATNLVVEDSYGLQATAVNPLFAITGSDLTVNRTPSVIFNRCRLRTTDAEWANKAFFTTSGTINGYKLANCQNVTDHLDLHEIRKGLNPSTESRYEGLEDLAEATAVPFDDADYGVKSLTVDFPTTLTLSAVRNGIKALKVDNAEDYTLKLESSSSGYVDCQHVPATANCSVSTRYLGTFPTVESRASGQGFLLYGELTGGTSYRLYLIDAAGSLQSFGTTANWDATKWQTLGLTINGTTAKAYVEGQLVGTLTIATPVAGPKLWISRSNGAYRNGRYKDFYFYETALADADMLNIHNGSPPSAPALQLALDDNSTTLANVGSAGDALAVNPTWETPSITWPGNVVWKSGSAPTWTGGKSCWLFLHDGTDFIEF